MRLQFKGKNEGGRDGQEGKQIRLKTASFHPQRYSLIADSAVSLH